MGFLKNIGENYDSFVKVQGDCCSSSLNVVKAEAALTGTARWRGCWQYAAPKGFRPEIIQLKTS